VCRVPAGKALQHAAHRLPEPRRQQLEQLLADHFGGSCPAAAPTGEGGCRAGPSNEAGHPNDAPAVLAPDSAPREPAPRPATDSVAPQAPTPADARRYEPWMVQAACRLQPRVANAVWVSHAQRVVAAVTAGAPAAAAPAAVPAPGGAAQPASSLGAAAAADPAPGAGVQPAGGLGAAAAAAEPGAGVREEPDWGVATPAEAAIEAFVRGWRQHFLDSMAPQHLPAHWSVGARVANSSIKGATVTVSQRV